MKIPATAVEDISLPNIFSRISRQRVQTRDVAMNVVPYAGPVIIINFEMFPGARGIEGHYSINQLH